MRFVTVVVLVVISSAPESFVRSHHFPLITQPDKMECIARDHARVDDSGVDDLYPSSRPFFTGVNWSSDLDVVSCSNSADENGTVSQLSPPCTMISDTSAILSDTSENEIDSNVDPDVWHYSGTSWSTTCSDDGLTAHLGAHHCPLFGLDQSRLLFNQPCPTRSSTWSSDEMFASHPSYTDNLSLLANSGLSTGCGPSQGLMSSHIPSTPPNDLVGFTDCLASPMKPGTPSETWPSARVSSQPLSLPSCKHAAKVKTTRYHYCRFPDCRKKPFHRLADLVRHHRHLHTADHCKTKYFCDYPRCPRNQNCRASDPLTLHMLRVSSSTGGSCRPFGRQDHFREHLREYHGEDLLKRARRNVSSSTSGDGGSSGSSSECADWWDNRRIDPAWWRCSKCLRRIKVKKLGYTCDSCSAPCDPERVRFRKAKMTFSKPTSLESSSLSDASSSPSSESTATATAVTTVTTPATLTAYHPSQEAQGPGVLDPLPPIFDFLGTAEDDQFQF